MINVNKSALFFSPNTRNELRERITNLFGVQSTKNMGKYLGIPTLVGRDRRRAFRDVKERLIERVKSWCNRTLSQGGKEVYIKSVLQAIPTYIMSCFLFQDLFVMTWILSLKIIGGDIIKKRKGFIGWSGKKCVCRNVRGVLASRIWQNLILPCCVNKVGGCWRTLTL